jgi:hypothetical protein
VRQGQVNTQHPTRAGDDGDGGKESGCDAEAEAESPDADGQTCPWLGP